MTRGLFILLLQVAVSIGVTAIGVCAIALPDRLQAFINRNFALLPEPRSGSFVTPVTIRIAGFALILYGYTLALNFMSELVWLGKVFAVAKVVSTTAL
jgi:hypothetical protein